jgi:transcriptional regulator with XRE-family HTH domain
MVSTKEIFAENLKKFRKKSGLSQGKLAEKAEISTHHIAMIETARNFPTPGIIERIADILNIQVYELFIEEDFFLDELKQLRHDIRSDIRQELEDYFGNKPLNSQNKTVKRENLKRRKKE